MRIWPITAKQLFVALVIFQIVGGSTASAGILATAPNALPYDSSTLPPSDLPNSGHPYYNPYNGPGDAGHSDTLWRGTVHVGPITAGLNRVNADVDYAVFTAEEFGNFMTANALSTANGAILDALDNDGYPQLIYAYQINVPDYPGTASDSSPGVTRMSVGLHNFVNNFDKPGVVGNELAPWNSGPSFLSGGGGTKNPSTMDYNTSSMIWNFSAANTMTPGTTSRILVYSSRYLPEWDKLTLSANLAANPSGTALVPSIGPHLAPEPSSVVFVVIGAGAFLLQWRRRV